MDSTITTPSSAIKILFVSRCRGIRTMSKVMMFNTTKLTFMAKSQSESWKTRLKRQRSMVSKAIVPAAMKKKV